jgi:hypothetical protein
MFVLERREFIERNQRLLRQRYGSDYTSCSVHEYDEASGRKLLGCLGIMILLFFYLCVERPKALVLEYFFFQKLEKKMHKKAVKKTPIMTSDMPGPGTVFETTSKVVGKVFETVKRVRRGHKGYVNNLRKPDTIAEVNEEAS